jgi:hypothetical protein
VKNNAPTLFKKTPRPGQSLSLNGLAEGLAKMEHALQTLSVHKGRVDWQNGEPKIIFDGEKKAS